MPFDCGNLKTAHGLMKVLALVFILMDLIIMRVGGKGGGFLANAVADADTNCLVFVTVGGFAIIHTILFSFVLFGEAMATKMVKKSLNLARP